jgi:hypothetical protein
MEKKKPKKMIGDKTLLNCYSNLSNIINQLEQLRDELKKQNTLKKTS